MLPATRAGLDPLTWATLLTSMVACTGEPGPHGPRGATGAAAGSLAMTITCDPPTKDGSADQSRIIGDCLRSAKPGDIVALTVGVYRMDAPVTVDRGLTLTSVGAQGLPLTCLASEAPPCAELRASPSLNVPDGLLRLVGADITLDHLVLNGNRRARVGTASWTECGRLGGNRRMGFTSVATRCDRCRVQFNAIVGTLCGSSLELGGDDAVIRDNSFLDSGDPQEAAGPEFIPRISDGFSVTGARYSVLSNLVQDATDQAIILFDGPGAVVEFNEVRQTDEARPVYSGITIDNSGLDGRGNFVGAEIRGNRVICSDGGPRERNCHFGIAIGSGPWRPPPTTAVKGPAVHGNVVRHARQGIVVEGAGVEGAPVRVWNNDVADSEPEFWNGFIAALGVRLGCSAEPVGVHLTSDRSMNPATSVVCFGPRACPPPPEREVWRSEPAYADWRACY